MEIQLLGTAAAEGYPAIFCKCEACQNARVLGGKNIRTRTSAIIDQQLKIDFPPDSYHHVLTYNLNLADIQHILFTHTHHDHFYPEDLTMRSPVFAHHINYPLHIYGNDAIIAKCKSVAHFSEERFTFHRIMPFISFTIEEFQIIPLLADHDQHETCFIFYIEKGNQSILYGHDTGWFPQATWDWLYDKTMDIVILDCTHGLNPGRRNHMNIEAVKDIKEIFLSNGNIQPTSPVIATHFSHNTQLTHSQLKEILEPAGIIVAYDGMKISV